MVDIELITFGKNARFARESISGRPGGVRRHYGIAEKQRGLP
jgi:hypothetical protein